MKILQVACGFSYSKVYEKLFDEFKKSSTNFEVYVPQHSRKQVNSLEQKSHQYKIYSSHSIKKYDKLLYYTKIWRMVKDVEKNFDLANIKLLHAHSLFSDGAVAYNIYRKYKIPYIVTIRNTDVNKYFKYGIHLRKFALSILKNADHIIFISPSYKEHVFKKFIPDSIKASLLNKSMVISNGVDDHWLHQKKSIDKKIGNEVKLIFVGRVDVNKNLNAVILASKLLTTLGIENSVDIIGDGPLLKDLRKQHTEKNIVFYGAIKDINEMHDIYKKNDILVVPSFNETFGLVYIEAMSCGLPVIYSKNQGFDGNFDDGEVGFAVDPKNIQEIANSILSIINNYENISVRCLSSIKRFKWELISKEYIELYNYR